jgi:hypothetical protein
LFEKFDPEITRTIRIITTNMTTGQRIHHQTSQKKWEKTPEQLEADREQREAEKKIQAEGLCTIL